MPYHRFFIISNDEKCSYFDSPNNTWGGDTKRFSVMYTDSAHRDRPYKTEVSETIITANFSDLEKSSKVYEAQTPIDYGRTIVALKCKNSNKCIDVKTQSEDGGPHSSYNIAVCNEGTADNAVAAINELIKQNRWKK